MPGPTVSSPCYTYCYSVLFSRSANYCDSQKIFSFTKCICGGGDNDIDVAASADAAAVSWAQAVFDAIDHSLGFGWFSTAAPADEFGNCGIDPCGPEAVVGGRPGLYRTDNTCTHDSSLRCWCISNGGDDPCIPFLGTYDDAVVYAASQGKTTINEASDDDACNQCWCIIDTGDATKCSSFYKGTQTQADMIAASGGTTARLAVSTDGNACKGDVNPPPPPTVPYCQGKVKLIEGQVVTRDGKVVLCCGKVYGACPSYCIDGAMPKAFDLTVSGVTSTGGAPDPADFNGTFRCSPTVYPPDWPVANLTGRPVPTCCYSFTSAPPSTCFTANIIAAQVCMAGPVPDGLGGYRFGVTFTLNMYTCDDPVSLVPRAEWLIFGAVYGGAIDNAPQDCTGVGGGVITNVVGQPYTSAPTIWQSGISVSVSPV